MNKLLAALLSMCLATAAGAYTSASKPAKPQKRIGITTGWSQWGGEMTGIVASVLKKDAYDALPDNPDFPSLIDPSIPSFKERGLLLNRHFQFWVKYEHDFDNKYIPHGQFYFTEINHVGQSTSEFLIDPRPGFLTPEDRANNENPLWAEDVVETELDMKVYDVLAYYDFDYFENLAEFDVGLTLRKMHGSFFERLDARTTPYVRPAQTDITPIDLVMPLLYTKVQLNAPRIKIFDLPFDIYGSAVSNYISDGTSEMIDVDLEFGTMTELWGLRVGFFAGYRYAKLATPDMAGLYSDAFLEGARGGMKFDF